MQSLVDRSDGIAVGEYARLRVLAQLTQLYGDLNSVFRRDPEQELMGIALSVADHLFVAARHVLETASPHSLDLVPELISPEAMETGAPVRAVDAFVATGQILVAIDGGTRHSISHSQQLDAGGNR